MKLIVTGGGTGGHIYPALEVARKASESGAEITYLGSLRGQESRICQDRGIVFFGFPSEPLYSLKTPRGWRSMAKLLKSRSLAKAVLTNIGANVVFSTGGYAAGPVVSAARALKVPYVIHEGNSVPGRSNLLYAKQAHAFTTLFRSTERYAPGVVCKRVGHPIRGQLREAVSRRSPEPDFVLCVGGSQGSEYLNGSVPRAFAGAGLSQARLLISSGPANYETTKRIVTELGISDRVTVRPYLETSEMLDAYCRATVVIGRSGSTLAEFAVFGLPSVLVPLPTSAGGHQLHNAEEFVEMKAATLFEQADATPAAISEAVGEWLGQEGMREVARESLADWDLPNATDTIITLLTEASK